jgi:hypothetical protein
MRADGLECMDQPTQTIGERKQCRCMFCGLSAEYNSEEEAITHMTVCPALQEQLNDKENPFTLPKDMK